MTINSLHPQIGVLSGVTNLAAQCETHYRKNTTHLDIDEVSIVGVGFVDPQGPGGKWGCVLMIELAYEAWTNTSQIPIRETGHALFGVTPEGEIQLWAD